MLDHEKTATFALATAKLRRFNVLWMGMNADRPLPWHIVDYFTFSGVPQRPKHH